MKRIAAYLLQRWQYPNAVIAFGARVAHCTVDGFLSVGRNSALAGCRLERNVSVDHDTYVAESAIGFCSYVGPYSHIRRTTIGRFCSIGPYTLIGTGTHPTRFVSTSPVFYATRKQCGISFASNDSFEETRTIDIGHDVWIGARTFIADGLRVGSGAVIGAGAVVTRDVEPYAIVGGVPARLLRYRYPKEDVAILLELAWWTWPEGDLREAASLMAQSDVRSLLLWHEARASRNAKSDSGLHEI